MKQKLSILSVLMIAAVLLAFAGQIVTAQDGEAAAEKSLYERLGGVYAIASVVDALIEKLLVNETLNSNPLINEAHNRLPKAGIKFQVTALVCKLTGDPEKYSGRDMASSHAHLKISEKHWKAFEADFMANLNEFKVPEKEQGELLALVRSAKGDIVTVEE